MELWSEQELAQVVEGRCSQRLGEDVSDLAGSTDMVHLGCLIDIRFCIFARMAQVGRIPADLRHGGPPCELWAGLGLQELSSSRSSTQPASKTPSISFLSGDVQRARTDGSRIARKSNHGGGTQSGSDCALASALMPMTLAT